MKKIPVQIQLFFIMFSILVIPMSIITYYTSASMLEYSEQEIADAAMSNMESNSALTELALRNVILNVLKIVKENKFNFIKNIQTYKGLNSDFDRINSALKILEELQKMQSNDPIVYSVIFYMDDADYVLSTNKGIVTLHDFESMDWLDDAFKKIIGAEGVWYPRNIDKTTKKELQHGIKESELVPVISYVYRLSRLTTSTKGTLIVNVYEDQISKFMNSNKENVYSNGFIIDSNGVIISHPNKSLLYTDSSNIGYINNIIGNYQSFGYDIENVDEKRVLYTYKRASYDDWIYITTYSMETLLAKSMQLRRDYIILMAVIISVGTVLTIIISTRFSKPFKQLVKNLKNQTNFEVSNSGNELSYLSDAFDKIRKQEIELHTMLKTKVEETKSLAVYKLLNGDVNNAFDMNELKNIFPYNHYLVALITVDNIKNYMRDINAETRHYQRYMIIEGIKKVFPSEYVIYSTRYDTGTIAVIINIENYDHIKVPKTLLNTFSVVRDEVNSVRNSTSTIGISSVHTGHLGIRECVFEASEAIKQRLVVGKNHIIFWESSKNDNIKLHYSYSSEKKIINFIHTGDYDNVKTELNYIIKEIRDTIGISNDNILLIFNQLVGAIMKYLVEHNINTSKVLRSNVNIYSTIATLETIDEIEEFLLDVCKSIIEYNITTNVVSDDNYYDRVMKYLKEHYNEDIDFEDMSKKMGISYSYLRKLIKDETGKSLMDNLNVLRIEEVKRLLLHTNYTLIEIADEVGYHNVQSINRFFKKYEGISPSEFKNIKKKN